MPLREALGVVAVSTVASESAVVNDGASAEKTDLRDFDKRQKSWDTHRTETDEVEAIYASSPDPRHQRYAERIASCSQILHFARDPPPAGGKSKLKLKNVYRCQIRFCPVCQWRRSLRYQAVVYNALPELIADFPDTRFLFLTLTIKNCRVEQLRETLDLMCKAWQRLTQLHCWPARGWVRTVEITRSPRDRSSHPHFHCLLMVPPAYFQSDYLKQSQWAELWQQCLRVSYRPVVDIRVVKLALVPTTTGRVTPPPQHLWSAVAEILKYAIKPSDMIRDPEWLLAVSDQLVKTRAVAVGGILKHYLKRRRAKSISEPGETEPSPSAESLFFGWKRQVKRYKRIAP